MSSAQSAPNPVSESSGTTLAQDTHESTMSIPQDADHISAQQLPSPNSRPEQALETHEVLELQTFIDRKAWIEDRIKFLEAMPPIHVFVGLEALETSSEEVPGLPTHAELERWLVEHDKIEKDTEVLDAVELNKLRSFTRAATQRNLSPADTDLIELTLTTIYELDKLLHLLRDRSEHLDLLGIRLDWEDQRIASWRERRSIISGIESFLSNRARWSPAVYEHPEIAEHADIERRGSVGSVRSTTSDSPLLLPGFSRGTRFKMAELLSRDAAQFAGRVTTLRHGAAAMSGKILDKLIDHSRKPVPDILLDEQDRVEEKTINELESLGNFVMNMVMQWRKADEIYVESLKDQTAAKVLLEDLENAKMSHPTSKQNASFISRVETLSKRLSLRGSPLAISAAFPSPGHALFPQQQDYNQTITRTLADEIGAAIDAYKQAEEALQQYTTRYEGVKAAQSLSDSAAELSDKLATIVHQLQHGFPSTEGDGTPPDLQDTACLESEKHAVFVALLPTCLDELDKLEAKAVPVQKELSRALLRVDQPNTDPDFKDHVSASLQRLAQLRETASSCRSDTTSRVSRLREARKIWAAMDSCSQSFHAIQRDVLDALHKDKWKQVNQNAEAPPTPESPVVAVLPSSDSDVVFDDRLRVACHVLSETVDTPLVSVVDIVSIQLGTWLKSTAIAVTSLSERTAHMVQLLSAVRKQSKAMETSRVEFDNFMLRIEDIRERLESSSANILDGGESIEDLENDELELEVQAIQPDVARFIASFTNTIPFVSPIPLPKTTVSSADLSPPPESKLKATHLLPSPDLMFNIQTVNHSVRADSNVFVMRLNGGMSALEQVRNHRRIAAKARSFDVLQGSVVAELDGLSTKLSSFEQNFATDGTSLETLRQLIPDINELASLEQPKSMLSLSRLVRDIAVLPSIGDAAVNDLLRSRARSLETIEAKWRIWHDGAKSLADKLSNAILLEQQRADDAMKAEQARLQAEEEQRRLDQERQRVEEERLAEEAVQAAERERVQLEQEQREAEDAERKRKEERIAKEENERRRLVEEQEADERQARLAAENVERQRLQKEHSDLEEKLRLTEETLAHERRMSAEKELAALQQKPAEQQEDVFGPKIASRRRSRSPESNEMHQRLVKLRKRVHSFGTKVISTCLAKAAELPSSLDVSNFRNEFVTIQNEVELLPSSHHDEFIEAEITSLGEDMKQINEQMEHAAQLAAFVDVASQCDSALSDVLEHVDSYPSAPIAALSTDYEPDSTLPPASQLQSRLDYTRSKIDILSDHNLSDTRVASERERILQAWKELEEMGIDMINGRRTRSSSVASSSGSVSRHQPKLLPSKHERKISGYAQLSASTSTLTPRSRLTAPTAASSRRAVSGNDSTPTRERSATSGGRTVSGGNIMGTTFASRQRTNSLTPVRPTASNATPSRTPFLVPPPRRSDSPSLSNASSASRSHNGRPSSSMSTWSRAPRTSFPTAPRLSLKNRPSLGGIPKARKTYVANPKSKLDVAVGDVINNLPVGINIEGVSGNWKDQSGKYWIGNQDPKLCFCRILRSQTVMVRVGGGWTELSKFIRNHFADSFRLMTEGSPGSASGREEKWISSSTLLETPEETRTPLDPPRTPEPKELPSFAFTTPSGRSPLSVKSSPSTAGSPLTPLQFMRRAEHEPMFLRPETPSKPATHRTPLHTPSRGAVWRP